MDFLCPVLLVVAGIDAAIQKRIIYVYYLGYMKKNLVVPFFLPIFVAEKWSSQTKILYSDNKYIRL